MNPRAEITDLTTCRAIFAAWVFLYHVDLHAQFADYLGPAAGLIRQGYLGVDGFFILSGLILARVHPDLITRPEGGPAFWGRRLARIYPVHLATIVVLAVVVLIGLALGLAPRDAGRFTFGSLVENLLLIHGWGFTHHLAWNYPSWSVSTEWAGYLAFPIIYYFIGRWEPNVVAPILIICMTVLGAVAYFGGGTLNLTFGAALVRFFPEFLMGMCAATLLPRYADHLPNRMIAMAGIAGAVAGALWGWDLLVALSLWLTLTGLAMIADSERPPLFGQRHVLRFLGQISYAFYMSFGTIELLLAQLFRHQGYDPVGQKIVYVLAMTVLTLAYAIILHVFVEIPVRRTADRWLAVPAPLAGTGPRL